MRKAVNKVGVKVEHLPALPHTSFREHGKVKHETLSNLSALPETAMQTLRASPEIRTILEAGAPTRISCAHYSTVTLKPSIPCPRARLRSDAGLDVPRT